MEIKKITKAAFETALRMAEDAKSHFYKWQEQMLLKHWVKIVLSGGIEKIIAGRYDKASAMRALCNAIDKYNYNMDVKTFISDAILKGRGKLSNQTSDVIMAYMLLDGLDGCPSPETNMKHLFRLMCFKARVDTGNNGRFAEVYGNCVEHWAHIDVCEAINNLAERRGWETRLRANRLEYIEGADGWGSVYVFPVLGNDDDYYYISCTKNTVAHFKGCHHGTLEIWHKDNCGYSHYDMSMPEASQFDWKL